MMKLLIIFTLFITCCYCLEGNDLSILESRAKKKKASAKLLGMILLFVLSKVAIFKAVSVFLMMTLFQKIIALGGMIFKHFMKPKDDKPSPMYGPPQNVAPYDTIGYSYGPPEQEIQDGYPGTDIASSMDWLLNKHI